MLHSVLFLLFSSSLTLRRDKSILFNRLSINVLIYATILAIFSAYIVFIYKGIGLFGGLFNTTSTSQNFQVFLFIVAAIILQLTSFYPRKIWVSEHSSVISLLLNKFAYYSSLVFNKMAEQYKIIEYPLILLFIMTGALFLVSSGDLVSIFLSIELQSYGLYLLCTLYRNSELATKAGLTYFLLGGLSSCFILLGTSLLYTNAGSSNLDGIYVITSISDVTNKDFSSEDIYVYTSNYINMALLILSIGFLFKVSAAPFHFWSPDVYDSVPTIVTTFIAIIAKISIFIFLLELVHYTSNSLFSYQFTWTSSLLISSLLSLLVGAIVGLSQFRIKRLFAYSAISHVGFILLALGINSIESIQGFLFYLMQYSISNLNVFIILISVGFSLLYYTNRTQAYQELEDKNNSPVQLISQIKGYFYLNPALSVSLAITIFSFAGIPPLIGFFAKQMVLSAALDSGYLFITLIAILTSVVSAVYYLNILNQLFFDKADYNLNSEIEILGEYWDGTLSRNELIRGIDFKVDSIVLSSYLTITIAILTLMISLFIFSPQTTLNLTNIMSLILFNT